MNSNNYKYIRGLYVSQLELNLQTKIKNQLIDFFNNELELNESDLKVELELAMNSRISDLEDTIDIIKLYK